VNELGQTRPGETDEARIDDLAALGVAQSHAAINFIPPGFAGAGEARLVSWSGGQWYDLDLTPDGSGTFDISNVTQIDLDPVAPGIQNLPGGPEGFVWIDGANPGFLTDSLLVADWSADRISAYELDADSNPLVTTRRDFLTGLDGAEGAVIDPVTGDFLFSTFGGGDQLVRVSGFIAPAPPPSNDPPPTGDPAVIPLPASGWLLLAVFGLPLLRRVRA
jgi:hypothetical protein